MRAGLELSFIKGKDVARRQSLLGLMPFGSRIQSNAV